MINRDHIWKVGDIVTVHNSDPWHGGRGFSIHKVTRVLKRFIELDNGSQWAHGGWGYPHGGRGNSRLIFPVTDKHREAVRRDEAISILEKLRSEKSETYDKYKGHQHWEAVPVEKLEAAAEQLKGLP